MSYLSPEKKGEWISRRISIFGAAKSVISQLTIGQDMTKVSLPAAFLYPYSVLELGGVRALNYAQILCEMVEMEDPVDRIIAVAKWYLSSTMQEKFEKKPYNPILGERHVCWVDHPLYGKMIYHAEQTVHHPPVCAFALKALHGQIWVQGNISAAIKFHGNSVSMLTSGPTKIQIEKFGEEYSLAPVLPSLLIKNVILGTKRESWDGEVIIKCAKSGYQAKIFYKEEGWHCLNVARGSVTTLENPSVAIATFEGQCGEKFKLKRNNEEKVLANFSVELPNEIHYPHPSLLDSRNSLKLWEEVNIAIEADDMPKADALKRVIETEQRERRANNCSYDVQFFEFQEDPLETSHSGEGGKEGFWVCRKDKIEEYAARMMQPVPQGSGTPAPSGTEGVDMSSLSLKESN